MDSLKILTTIPDVDRLILEKLNSKDLITFYKIPNKYIRKLCDENFFRKRVSAEFPQLIEKPNYFTWKKYYFHLIEYKILLEERYNFISHDFRASPILYSAILKDYEGGITFVNEFKFSSSSLRKLNEVAQMNDGMLKATWVGYIDLIKYFIDLGANNLNLGLEEAASSSQKEAFDLFVSLGANSFEAALEDTTNPDMIKHIKKYMNF